MSTKATTLNSKKSVGALVKDWMSLVGIAILIVVFSIISYVKFGAQYFLTWSNWKNILLQSSTVAIVALGQSIMLLTGNFDLSLGRMVCLTSCVGAILMKNVGMSTGLAILIMFAIGLAVGAVNGFMVSYVGVPAMIATLGTQYICYGLAKLLTQAVPIANMPDSISFLGRGYIFGGVFPVCVLLMIIVIRCVQIGLRSGDNLSALVCFGVAASVVFQTFENVGMCIGIAPVVGITLPFFSYGGSSVLSMFMAMGLVSGVRYRPKPVKYRLY